MSTSIFPCEREGWVDWMRISACFLVMMVHSTEPFYLGGDGSLILTRSDAFWVSFFDTLARACVPVFIVASSYLQFPLRYSASEFARRRAARILIPFLFWTVIYALINPNPIQNFKDLLFNFNYAAGHLWFVYMLIGLYVLMPLLSPWAEKVSRKEMQVYLLLCFLTTLVPYVRERAMGGDVVCIYGSGGIPMQAHFPLWGEASWNEFGVFYYFSGFVGYMLLGLYLRRFVGELSWGRTLSVAVPSLLTGFAICFFGFLRRVFADAGGSLLAGGDFPVGGGLDVAVGWETPWFYNSSGVALMTVGWVLLFRKCTCGGRFYSNVVLPVSKASYGMYLCHMIALGFFSGLFRSIFGLGGAGTLGVMTTPVEILLTAVCSFASAAIFCTLLRRVPYIGKWVIGY
ncbi:MAG: acyltransferase [Bacteroidales bacterium]|nr:acyltransferase [Candidatus Cacconaster caballi]